MTERGGNLRSLLADPMTPERLRQLQAEGKELREIARDWRVSYEKLVSWIATQGDLSEELKRVREIVGHELVGEALKIADTPKLGVEKKTKADGTTETTEGDMLGHRKLQVETRFRVAKAFAPRVYGEHQQVDWNVKFESEEEIRAKIRAVLARNPELKEQMVGLLEAKGLTLEAEIIENEPEKGEANVGAGGKAGDSPKS